MTIKTLEFPPSDIDTQPLPLLKIPPSKLLRISRHKSGEPYFGRSGSSRFDDPHNRYGTCYFGTKLTVAIAETVLHDEVAKGGKFEIAPETLESRYVIQMQCSDLRLANLTGASLKRFNGIDLSATASYKITQRWSLSIHEHPDKVDGFVYMSRHLNTDKAIVLFDRAKSKISMVDATLLLDFKGFAYAGKKLGMKGV